MAISNPYTASAQATSGADLAVRLDAIGAILLAGARYTVSITNNGPEPLTAATVVVRLDHRVYTGGTSECPLDTTAARLTCSFGALPVGSTTSLSAGVYFLVNGDRATLDATATRTASVPIDRGAKNDTDTVTCWYERPEMGSTWPPPTVCGS